MIHTWFRTVPSTTTTVAPITVPSTTTTTMRPTETSLHLAAPTETPSSTGYVLPLAVLVPVFFVIIVYRLVSKWMKRNRQSRPVEPGVTSSSIDYDYDHNVNRCPILQSSGTSAHTNSLDTSHGMLASRQWLNRNHQTRRTGFHSTGSPAHSISMDTSIDAIGRDGTMEASRWMKQNHQTRNTRYNVGVSTDYDVNRRTVLQSISMDTSVDLIGLDSSSGYDSFRTEFQRLARTDVDDLKNETSNESNNTTRSLYTTAELADSNWFTNSLKRIVARSGSLFHLDKPN